MQSRVFFKDILKTIEGVIDYYSQEIGSIKDKSNQAVMTVTDLEARLDIFKKVRLYLKSDEFFFTQIIKEVLNKKYQSQEQSDADIPFHEASDAPTEVSLKQPNFIEEDQ